jgi:hypothetical protein
LLRRPRHPRGVSDEERAFAGRNFALLPAATVFLEPVAVAAAVARFHEWQRTIEAAVETRPAGFVAPPGTQPAACSVP